MPSNESPKKTSTRAKLSPKPRKDNSEQGSVAAKHHRTTKLSVPPEKTEPSDNTPSIKAMTASVGLESMPTAAVIVDSVGVEVPPPAAIRRVVSREQIAELAHSYFVSRGHNHGSHDEDWLRAELELNHRR